MAFAKRAPAWGIGLDKKHDQPVQSRAWQPTTRMRPWASFRKRRILLILIGLCVVYFFIKYLPTDLPTAGQRIDSRTGLSQGRAPSPPTPGRQSDEASRVGAGHAGQRYDGPVKFYNLAGSLRPHSWNHDEEEEVKRENVLFALYDLRSAGTLISLACNMGLRNRVRVHMALLSTTDHKIEEIMVTNGLKHEDCPIFWHDGRPDYNTQSTIARQDIVVKSAAHHIHAAIKPSVVIIDEQQASNARFTASLRSKLDSLWTPLTIIPTDIRTSMPWLTSLDGKALGLLNRNQIDILIQPYRQSAGSLIRLLESIRNAQYSGLPLPRITIELPHEIDPFALRYLDNFRWPSDSPIGQSKLILRRRIDNTQLTPALASLRTAESFYPPTWPTSHVLVLSPDVELSPEYLQYLYFTTLLYKYGTKGLNVTSALMGISLDLPTTLTDTKDKDTSDPFLLSQTPSHIATLYFGDKWIDLQSYISLRLHHDPDLFQDVSSTKSADIGARHSSSDPAWVRLAVDMMEAMNYFVLYPAFAAGENRRLVTVHGEMSQMPEEYALLLRQHNLSKGKTENERIMDLNHPPSAALSAIPDPDSPHNQKEYVIRLKTLVIAHLLKDEHPMAHDIPLFDAHGKSTTWNDSAVAAKEFSDWTSLSVGGCYQLEDRDEMMLGRVGGLFCEAKE